MWEECQDPGWMLYILAQTNIKPEYLVMSVAWCLMEFKDDITQPLAVFDQFFHISKEEGQNKCFNVATINIGITHNYNFMVS